MPIGTAAAILGGVALAGSIGSSIIGGKSAKSAASTQADASYAGIAEQRRQFNETKALLAPFIEAGESALGEQVALAGLSTPKEYENALQRVVWGPEFQARMREGEEAILSHASATGGLRGGNTQAALAQFRPQLLAQMVNDKYARLGGLTGIGQASATGQAAHGAAMAGNVANLQQSAGAARAGGQLAQGQMYQNVIGDLTQGAGMFGRMAGVF